MVYKVYSQDDAMSSVEFIQKKDGLLISSQIESDGVPEIINVEIDVDTLFELIGGLLRIQSKFKRNGNNGNTK